MLEIIKNTHYKLFRITTVPISLEKLIEGQAKYMSSNGFDVFMISSDFDRKKQLELKEHAQFIPINMTRSISPLKDLQALIKLFKTFKQAKPLIIHSHTPKAGLLSMVAGKFAGVPIRLHTVAGMPLMETKGFKRMILNVVEKITYACATKVYPNSFGLLKVILENRFAEAKKVKVLGNGSSNGINTKYFDRSQVSSVQQNLLRKSLNILEDDFVFIFVGRVVGDKGINELIFSFKEINETHKYKVKIKLLIVGPYEPDLDPINPETDLEIRENNNIIHVGWQDDVRPYFSISDALVFPSYREGFPNVVMQAGAMGLPSIVSNINGCNEIIVEGENGIIIPVKDKESLKLSMLKMLKGSDLYQKMKNNSRRMIVERYNQELLWKEILEEYHSLIDRKIRK